MAIAFAQVKYLSRSKALQATAAAAYRSCSIIYDERTGETFDFTSKKSPLLHSEILLPENANAKFKDRELLWNAVEKIEIRRNSQVAKEVVLALPKDEAITDENKIELARQFAITHFVNKGVAVDLNIHNEEGNPHAHLLIYEQDNLIVSEETMCNALKMADLLTEHAIAAYGLMGIDPIQHDAKIVLNWITSHGKLTFTKSELILAMRNKKLGKAECLQKALNLLIDRNLISPPQRLPTRKPTTVYYVHPSIITKAF